jgi:hypothetical protein
MKDYSVEIQSKRFKHRDSFDAVRVLRPILAYDAYLGYVRKSKLESGSGMRENGVGFES